jgi:hypothetical protein
MRVLQSRLYKRNKKNGFDHLDNRIRCHAHIVNICSSHVIASMTSTPESYLSSLKVPVGSSHAAYCDSDSGSDNGDNDDGLDAGGDNSGWVDGASDGELDDGNDGDEDSYINELELADSFNDQENFELGEWFTAIRCDPLKRARKLINFLRSSTQRKEGLSDLIEKGNASNRFIVQEKGQLVVCKVPELQLLKDVKTRWDSVFLMLQRLRQLRPVRLSMQLMLEVY